MAQPPNVGRGRGLALKGLLMKRMEEKASEAPAMSPGVVTPQPCPTPPLAQPLLQPTAQPSPPASARPLSRGRGVLMNRMKNLSIPSTDLVTASAKAKETPSPSVVGTPGIMSPKTSAPPVAVQAPVPFGRGRGVKPAGPPPSSSMQKFGSIKHDDDGISFKSDDFDTSSRIGLDKGKPVNIDMAELEERLKCLETSGSLPPDTIDRGAIAQPSKSSGTPGAVTSPRSILKPSPPEALSPPMPLKPTLYRGLGGKPIEISSNYIKLTVDEGCGIFEYEVIFDPPVDSRDERYKAVNQQKDKLGQTKSFDGHKLYLPRQLEEPVVVLTSVHSASGLDIKLTLRFKRQLIPGERETIYLYNVCFHKIMKTLKYAQNAKRGNFFDPQAAKDIKEFKLSIWPGYITAVDVFESGLHLQLDVAHRVLRTETVRDVLINLRKKGAGSLIEEAEKALLGCSVITRYNNKTYKVDGIEFSENPMTEFTLSSGEKVTFLDYYKKQYGITITDIQQPLLIHRPKVRGTAEVEAERIIKLVPEFCFMTGLTEAMRSDFKIMKEVGSYTRLSPAQRQDALNNFLNRVMGSPEAYSHLRAWGLNLSKEPVILQARVLSPETLCFGNNYKEVVRPNADWGRTATSKNVLTPVPLNKWAILFLDKNEVTVKNFCKILQQQGPKMGIHVAMPKVVKLPNDRTETYLKEMRNLIDPSVQLVLTIFPQLKSDRYAAIKKLCCVEMPIASQVVNLKTISNEKRLTSVVQKVALQINCKLGGELWACLTPFKDLMVVGIDVYHDKSRKSGSIAGVVTSLNDASSRYFSSAVEQKQGQEIMDALRVAFIEGLIKYWETNRKWPANIVVFRDGVGDGQLEATEKHEAEQFLRVLHGVGTGTDPEASRAQTRLTEMLPQEYRPGFVFVVVQKRINTRILAAARRGPKYAFDNPPPGTVLDHSVTRYHYKDFFLVPQAVNQGTVSPTHFIVLKELLTETVNGMTLDASGIQKLAYQLTHMYFNWPGTVRVPAPVQYAHKLVDLIGQHVHRLPSKQLSDRLFYL